jgi:anthranilate synthase/aminodeoxychorismate synthase-like glutamine amidotransferase
MTETGVGPVTRERGSLREDRLATPPASLGSRPPGCAARVQETASPVGRVTGERGSVRVLVIDNYDSFAYNLVQYLGELGAEVDVVRNDRATVDELLERRPDRLVVSPGPCTPDRAGISVEAMRRLPEAGIPALGVCLGHQSLAEAFGGRVVRHDPVHGKATTVVHDGRTIFTGLDSPLTAGRYHSLVVDPALPACFERSAEGAGVVMGIRHRELPAEGVQFHPESVLTEGGRALLDNFVHGPGR